MKPLVTLLPDATDESRHSTVAWSQLFRSAILDGGGEVVENTRDANALVWMNAYDASPVARILDENPNISWIQLPWAGVESFAKTGLFERPVHFTCAKGAYGEQVGEHALVLTLACLRSLTKLARTKEWLEIQPVSLFRKRVTVLGAGGLAQTFTALLEPFHCDITVLRRSDSSIDRLHETLPNTDVLVLALSLTPETEGIIGADELALLPPSAIVVNVARGRHIDTDALVNALRDGQIAAAGLDVTDPEPLPADHPLWQMDNVLITSHRADSDDFLTAQLAQRIKDNVRRLINNEALVGLVDRQLGY